MIADALNQAVAETAVTTMLAQNFHWNVTGMAFAPLHELFQQIYEDHFQAQDDLAERIKALDAHAEGTLAVQNLKAIRIEPGQVLTLQPGAIWLELEGVQQSFNEGQYFHMDLTFETAGSVEIDVGVNAAEEDEGGPSS